MKNYIGITLGPIFDTICEATSPAGLWFASTMFSDVTRRLCMEIIEQFKDATILSPAFDENDKEGLKDGVGKYHDRVFFTTDEPSQDEISKKLDAVIDKVKAGTVDLLCEKVYSDKEAVEKFFTEYIYIEYVIMDETNLNGENCLLAMGCYLDELELMQISKVWTSNPLEAMLTGPDSENRNGYIKESGLLKTVDPAKNHIQDKKGRIISIEDIAGITGDKQAPKYTKYFAVINADGDRMGKFLQGIGNDSRLITAFSASCLKYNKLVAEKINEFGGMPIYAGGDDLLFLAPVIGKEDGKTVFALCAEISKLFVDCIKKTKIGDEEVFADIDTPSLSFGVSIQYYKYPLYEALAQGRELLHVAKADESNIKNRMAIRLEKHSGQTTGIIIRNDFVPGFDEFIRKQFDGSNAENKAIHAISYKLQEFAAMIQLIDLRVASGDLSRSEEHYPWDNLFDSDSQREFKNYLRFVQDWYYDKLIQNAADVATFGSEREDNVHKMEVVLRFAKFLVEGGAENE